MPDLPKAYEPQTVEEKWYEFWLKHDCFTANPRSSKPPYSIVIPPPNVTGVLHMGHVLNNTIQDLLARKARMEGKEVLWLPGTDHAGIATQTVVERTLRKQGLMRHRDDLGREKFLEHVWAWKEKQGGIIIQQLKKLGCSCDWTRQRFTMDPEYSRCVQKVFIDLYNKGLIYRGKRMVNWDPAARTALSDEEVEMTEEKGALWHLKYPLLDAQGRPKADEFVVVATTRPETMLGDEAVAVNPSDPRYTALVGRRCLLPLRNKAIPVIADVFVDPKFGTGCVKVTPAHDPNDYQMALRHGLPLTVVIGPDGAMTPEAGTDFAGLDRMEARQAVLEKLTAQGLLLKTEDYVHNVGYSQRSHVPIEPFLSEQWFLKYPSVEQATSCVELASLEGKMATVVTATGEEISAPTIHELRDAARCYARRHGFLGSPFRNEDSGIEIRVRRDSLSHAFSNRGAANMKAVAVLPDLIQKAILVSTRAHQPPHSRFRSVHRFVAALSLRGELHKVLITAKELADGSVLYDHKVKKTTLGGKSLVAHPPKEKLGIQPAPSAAIKVADLLADVNFESRSVRYHPDRWTKTYSHWMQNLRDWCISRQLWWGHQVPVWSRSVDSPDFRHEREEVARKLDSFKERGALLHSDLQIPELQEITRRVLANVPTVLQLARWHVAVGPDEVEVVSFLEGHGFRRDPDVLDTWFSSWLWPFATMGWPEQTETLKKFYPTTDLVTGPDIIFFWVARMIMAGYEFMGDLPFRNVYFTGIIRDKLGRKMSKSLGNSPDPLELIAKYGADALRFGTMRSAPLGQDVLFDEKDVELGRNFCNKLWNACRFRQMHGGEVQGEIEPGLLSGDDKWILLKLDQAIREITNAFAEYRFNEASQTLYRFFWSEYCDWYVEASKAVLSRPTETSETRTAGTDSAPEPGASDAARRRANTLAVLDFILSHTLRLFHPFLPFITEELWHGMGYHEDMPEDQGGRTIMYAPWPKAMDQDFRAHYGLDEPCLAAVNAKYDLVTQGRNLRREANLPASKKVKFVFKPAQPLAPHDAAVLKLLLNAEALEINPAGQPPKGTPTVHSDLGDLYLPLEGQVDTAAEAARLNKELEKIDGEIAKAAQKLNNPNFTAKAPAPVLQEHRQRLAEWQAKRERAKAALQALNR
jgi:valyl-tRNA synthetase